VDGALTFDYLLKPGVSSTRNAIAWLEALGYPPAVVSAAHAAVGATDARQPEPPG
jgi:DNA mismatch repair ATPase MutS